MKSMGETQAAEAVRIGEEWGIAPPGKIVDAVPGSEATLDDLDLEGMYRFVRIARGARQFPLPAETPPEDLLRYLNLLKGGRLTNAAMLLFGKVPQRFLNSSVIECAHFHGTAVAEPIPFHRVYKGTAFALVDQAVDFVLGKIALSVGTRAESVRAPVAYEIPKQVVTEAIVNAVAHRDYTDSGSTQVMLFADRLEVMNPGRLPPPLTVEKLRVPPVAARQSAACGVDVPAAVHREDGDRDGGHDPALRRGRPAGAGVRGRREIRDADLAGSEDEARTPGERGMGDMRQGGRRSLVPLGCLHGASPLSATRFVSAPVAQPG